MILPKIIPKHRNILIITSIITKIFVIFLTTYIFNSFVDMWDYQIYFRAIQNIFNGTFPWTSGVTFYYPPLACIPMTIAYFISFFAGFFGFVLVMWTLMIICDIVTTLCVYYIGLKLYSEKTAFIAAMLSASALSSAYFIITRFDAFPTCLAMVAILATIYGDKITGYFATIFGFFTKLWPMLLFPFLWIYNSRDTSLMVEGKERAFWFLTASFILFGLMIWGGYNRFLEYADMVYCNTIPYVLHQYMKLAGIIISFNTIAILCKIFTILVIIIAIYIMFNKSKSIVLMLKLILITLIVLILFSQYRSPQYIVWFSPIAAILVAEDIWGILIFIFLQILAYVEFPLGYYVMYVNDHYTSEWALWFFSILFITYGLLIWRALKMKEHSGENTQSIEIIQS
jgi:hypothetical protein